MTTNDKQTYVFSFPASVAVGIPGTSQADAERRLRTLLAAGDTDQLLAIDPEPSIVTKDGVPFTLLGVI